MKYLIILADGMADHPIGSLGNKTPLEAVSKPAIDRLAREGVCGRLVTVPSGFQPGSEIANLGVLGYDVSRVYEGRGSLEAASMGVSIDPDEVAMRCNLIYIRDEKIVNHSAGHISTGEAAALMATLQQELGNEQIHFYPGVSYRHLLKIRNGRKQIHCTPPHDVPGALFRSLLPVAETPEAEDSARLLRELILKSQEILANHPVNRLRVEAGKDPANSIWPWSPGYRPSMQTMQELYGIKTGAVISAVDLIHGIGIYAGLDKIEVEGATGLYNTNYEGKAEAALQALKEKDFVFLHIEAPDEAGHEGDITLKMQTIRDIDQRIVAPILQAIETWTEPVRIALLPDHPTPCELRTHTAEPVPFAIWGSGMEPDSVTGFTEKNMLQGSCGTLRGDEFIRKLLM